MTPHQDVKLTQERMKCFKNYLSDLAVLRIVQKWNFTIKSAGFAKYDYNSDMLAILQAGGRCYQSYKLSKTHGVYA